MSTSITVAGSDVTFECQDGQTVLDAAEAAGWSIPYSCRKGVCTTCAGGVIDGQLMVRGGDVVQGPADDVLLCQGVPSGPVQIAPCWIRASTPPRRKTVHSRVYRVCRQAPRVTIVELRFPIGLRAPFEAGQYLRVLLADGDSRLYSMANSPQHNDGAQLHVRTEPGGQFSDHIVRRLQPGDPVTVELPFGEFALDLDDDRCDPIILIATGTGFAPLKSMIEHKIAIRDRRPVHLYWGARAVADLYLAGLVQRWARRHHWFRFTPVISQPSPNWPGATGWVQHAIVADYPDLRRYDVYACGSEAMITSARNVLTSHSGLPQQSFHSDAFLPSATPIVATPESRVSG